MVAEEAYDSVQHVRVSTLVVQGLDGDAFP